MEELLKSLERKCQDGIDKSKSMPWAKDFLIEVLREIQEELAAHLVFNEEKMLVG